MTTFWQDVFNIKHFKAYMTWLAKVVGISLGILAGGLVVATVMMWMMIEASEKHYKDVVEPQIQQMEVRRIERVRSTSGN